MRITLRDNKGSTLIELAMTMLAVGVLFATLAPLYTQYLKHQELQQTQTNVDLVAGTIGNFRTLHGRYPCPAPLAVDRSDPTYGHEGNCDVSDPGFSGAPPGNCDAKGRCRQKSIDSRMDASGNYMIQVGAVPFRALNLPESAAYDGHGMKLRYAVTEHLAIDTTFSPDTGGIDIRNAQGDSLVNPPGSAHFLVLSHGENSAGGYSRSGAQLPCPKAGNNLEKRNCIVGVGGGAPPAGCSGGGGAAACAVYTQAPKNTSETNVHFDDVISYFIRDDIPLWQVSETKPMHIHQKPTGSVGFNVDESTLLTSTVTVNGFTRAGEKLKSVELCDANGLNCFVPSLIGGTVTSCPPGEFMTGIKNGSKVCSDEIVRSCPNGAFFVGFDTDGSLICDTAACSAGPTKVCDPGDTFNLPLGTDGQQFTFTDSGSGVKKTYTCTPLGWDTVQDGMCNCDPNETKEYDKSCQEGWSGGIIKEKITRVCPAGTWSEPVIISNTCTCNDGLPDTMISDCSTAYNSGEIQLERFYKCDPNGDGDNSDAEWGGWTEAAGGNTCACNEKTESQTRTCPAGYTGTWQQTRNTSCPGALVSAWTPDTPQPGECTCNSSAKRYKTDGCGTGYTGTIKYEDHFLCPGEVWAENWVEIENTCEKIPPVVCNWNPASQGQKQFSPGSENQVGSQCSCGAGNQSCYEYYTGTYYVYSNCSCE